MLIYQSTKQDFLKDLFNHDLVDKITKGYVSEIGGIKEAEVRSWNNSFGEMGRVLNDPDIPDDAGVAIEYRIPYTNRRVDMILSGKDSLMRHIAIVIELKQWESCSEAGDQEDVVITYLGGGERSVPHPSYQAWSYVQFIKDFNVDVQDLNIGLEPCAYLHNYIPKENDHLYDTNLHHYLQKAPVFVKKEAEKLQDFIKRFIRFGDNKETLYHIENGKLRPSKSLQEKISSMLEGNPEFVMMDEQKTVFETALESASKSAKDGKKRVLIVEGGPGTGKSVVAINLLSRMLNMGISSFYVTRNAAPRKVYSTQLKGTKKKGNLDNLFLSSLSLQRSKDNEIGALIVDEAHRLNRRAFNQPGDTNQVRDILRSAYSSVFFIDEDQMISTEDYCTIAIIGEIAKEFNASVKKMELESQFRCDGSDGYIAWLDHILEIRKTANFDGFNMDYDFKVFDDPNELRRAIEEKNRLNNRSRMVAGYCWDWPKETQNNPDYCDVRIDEYGFSMSWNLGGNGIWAIDEGTVDQLGCIHTCQGLEFEYVGVIIGDDMVYRDDAVVTDVSKRAKTDLSIKGLKTMAKNDPVAADRLADRIIKNTYRTLMTRGQKGCYIYCTDKQISQHFEKFSLMKDKSIL